MEDLKAVLNAQIPSHERLLWARIYLLVGYKAFSGPHADVAALFDLSVWTFKYQLNALRKRGAIVVKSKYNKDRTVEGIGSRYELVHPDLWLPAANR